MVELDVDLSILDELDDKEISNILKRLSLNGFATFKNDRINNRISIAASPLRKQKALIMGPDRRSSFHFIAINDNIFGVEKLIASCWNQIINDLK